MANYRCFFVDTSNALVESDGFVAKNDNAALARVASSIRRRGYQGLGFELWEGGRLARRLEPNGRGSGLSHLSRLRPWATSVNDGIPPSQSAPSDLVAVAISVALLVIFVGGILH